MDKKTKKILTIIYLILLIDVIATGLFSSVLLHLLAIENKSNSIGKVTNYILSGPGVLLLLSPSYFLAAPIIGFYSDILGRKCLLFYTICSNLIGYILALFGIYMDNLIIMLLALALLGIGNSILSLSLTIVSDLTISKSKSLSMAYISIITSMLVISVLLGNKLLSNFNYEIGYYPIVISSIICFEIANLYFIKYWLPETNSRKSKIQDFTIENALKSITVLLFKKEIYQGVFIFFIVQCACGIFTQLIFVDFTNSLNIFTEKGRYFLYYRLFFTLLGLTVFYPFFVKRFNNENILILSYILVGIGFFGIYLSIKNYFDLFFYLSIGLGFAIFEPTIWSHLSNKASRFHQGLVLGLLNPIWLLAWLMSGLITATNKTIQTIPVQIAFSVLA